MNCEAIDRIDHYLGEIGGRSRSLVPQSEVVDLLLDLRAMLAVSEVV